MTPAEHALVDMTSRLTDACEELLQENAALVEALRTIKTMVTGQLPLPVSVEMATRCARIADVIDAALAGRAGRSPWHGGRWSC